MQIRETTFSQPSLIPKKIKISDDLLASNFTESTASQSLELMICSISCSVTLNWDSGLPNPNLWGLREAGFYGICRRTKCRDFEINFAIWPPCTHWLTHLSDPCEPWSEYEGDDEGDDECDVVEEVVDARLDGAVGCKKILWWLRSRCI